MRPDPRFLGQAKDFWAHVRTISQRVGYTDRKTRQIKVPTLPLIRQALQNLNLSLSRILDEHSGQITDFGATLLAYFHYRADVLNTYVEPRLMTLEEARTRFTELRGRLNPKCPLPLNKQAGAKKDVAFFTGIINMLIEQQIGGLPCDYNPQALTAVTSTQKTPLRTLARRVDGAFPHIVDPIAVWEIKEYYYTKTFGSRVADGVYETLLDGLELEELRHYAKVDIKHYLMVDDHYTWWVKGRSYLCRIVDMMHMGYVDEALFGREVFERLPELAQEWADIARQHPTLLQP